MKKKNFLVIQIMLFLFIGGLLILKSSPTKASIDPPVGHQKAYNVWCQQWPTQVPGCRDHAWRTCYNTNFCND